MVVEAHLAFLEVLMLRPDWPCLILEFGAQMGHVKFSFCALFWNLQSSLCGSGFARSRVGSCDNCLFHRKETLDLGRM